MEAADAEAAQTETLKKFCAKDKCEVDPKAIFDTSSCPGTIGTLYVTEKITSKISLHITGRWAGKRVLVVAGLLL